MVSSELVLLEVRMQLDLVDRGRHAALVQDARELGAGEVRDADRPQPSMSAQIGQRAPGLDEPGSGPNGPVHEVQITDSTKSGGGPVMGQRATDPSGGHLSPGGAPEAAPAGGGNRALAAPHGASSAAPRVVDVAAPAGLAGDDAVLAGTSGDVIVAGACEDEVIARAPGGHVVATAARIRNRAAGVVAADPVVAGAAREPVIGRAPDDDIVAGTAGGAVLATAAFELARVRSLAGRDRVA